jgi:hypothetical protein
LRDRWNEIPNRDISALKHERLPHLPYGAG